MQAGSKMQGHIFHKLMISGQDKIFAPAASNNAGIMDAFKLLTISVVNFSR